MENLLSFNLTVEDVIRMIPMLFALYLSVKAIFLDSKPVRSRVFLAVLFFLFAAIQFELLVYNLHFKLFARHMLLLFVPAIMALLPVNYLFLRSLSQRILVEKHHNWWLHLLLPILVFIVCGFFYILSLFYDQGSSQYDFFYNTFWELVFFSVQYLFGLQCLIYIALIAKLYKQHKKAIAQIYSYDTDISLGWMTWNLIGYVIFVIIVVVAETTMLGDLRLIEEVIIFAYLLFIKMFSFRQIAVNNSLNSPAYIVDEQPDVPEVQEKYENSALKDEERIQSIAEKLTQFIVQEKPYLDAQLNIHKIAQAIGINTKYISQAIHQELKTNFISLINQYRIEEAILLMMDKDHDHYTLEAIGQMSGFNSKTTFYSAFKKLYQKTPAEFKAENK